MIFVINFITVTTHSLISWCILYLQGMITQTKFCQQLSFFKTIFHIAHTFCCKIFFSHISICIGNAWMDWFYFSQIKYVCFLCYYKETCIEKGLVVFYRKCFFRRIHSHTRFFIINWIQICAYWSVLFMLRPEHFDL